MAGLWYTLQGLGYYANWNETVEGKTKSFRLILAGYWGTEKLFVNKARSQLIQSARVHIYGPDTADDLTSKTDNDLCFVGNVTVQDGKRPLWLRGHSH